jgi:diguanylate cyclase
MSQVVERFERRIDDLEKALAAYREFAAALAARTGSRSAKEAERIAERVNEATAPSQLDRLLAELAAAPPPDADPVDGSQATSSALLLSFARGVVSLGDHDDPMVLKLEQAVREGFVPLAPETVPPLVQALERFFAAKREEFSVIGGEREDLKRLVASLIEYLHSFGTAHSTFQSRIEAYITGMEAAVDIGDVRQLQEAALREMRGAQESSRGMATTVGDARQRFEAAQRRIAELERALEQARRARWVDALTGIFNRGYFDKAMAAAVKEASTGGERLGLVMFDIDHFKRFNDTYGHRAGDQVLKTVARLAGEAVREGDLFCRYGGEEFAVILPKTDGKAGVVVAEAMRRAIREHEFAHKEEVLRVTVSLGVATLDREGGSVEQLVEAADRSLYAAKERGRDRVVGG